MDSVGGAVHVTVNSSKLRRSKSVGYLDNARHNESLYGIAPNE
jgi:hypothetical protein